MKTNEEINSRKKQFLIDIKPLTVDNTPELRALRSAINTAVRRTIGHPVYSASHLHRKEAVEAWRDKLVELGNKYLYEQQNMDIFVDDVLELREYMTNKFKDQDVFTDNIFRLGQAQKSFSIYLKVLWCENVIRFTPPACPIDARIIYTSKNYLKNKPDRHLSTEEKKTLETKWSYLNDSDVYKDILALVKEVSDDSNESLAIWELFNW